MSSENGIDLLLDALMSDPDVQKQWALNPGNVAAIYGLSESQVAALLAGDVESLIAEGLAERHVQEMRVGW